MNLTDHKNGLLYCAVHSFSNSNVHLVARRKPDSHPGCAPPQPQLLLQMSHGVRHLHRILPQPHNAGKRRRSRLSGARRVLRDGTTGRFELREHGGTAQTKPNADLDVPGVIPRRRHDRGQCAGPNPSTQSIGGRRCSRQCVKCDSFGQRCKRREQGYSEQTVASQQCIAAKRAP